MIEGRATARFVRGSPQKAGLVLDLIRGHDVNRALATLRFSRKGFAGDVSKVLRSAIANAQQKEGAAGDIDRLYVERCYADQGPSMKRIRAAPMGRAFRIIKRTSHLTVVVMERPEAAAAVSVTADSPTPASAQRPKRRASKSTRRRTTAKRVAKKARVAKTAEAGEASPVATTARTAKKAKTVKKAKAAKKADSGDE